MIPTFWFFPLLTGLNLKFGRNTFLAVETQPWLLMAPGAYRIGVRTALTCLLMWCRWIWERFASHGVVCSFAVRLQLELHSYAVRQGSPATCQLHRVHATAACTSVTNIRGVVEFKFEFKYRWNPTNCPTFESDSCTEAVFGIQIRFCIKK